MSATAAQVTRLRRMTSELSAATYSDEDLQGYIEAHPLIDERGEEPGVYDTSTSPPTWETNAGWVPTYDLHAAAADIWTEKAATLAGDFDFNADGANYQRSQSHEHATQMAIFHTRRQAARTITQRPEPEKPSLGWVANAAEED